MDSARKILLTGLATHQDTIRAINQAAIDKYIEKPWKSEELTASVRKFITEYLLETGIEYEAYTPYLDAATLFENIRKTNR